MGVHIKPMHATCGGIGAGSRQLMHGMMPGPWLIQKDETESMRLQRSNRACTKIEENTIFFSNGAAAASNVCIGKVYAAHGCIIMMNGIRTR